MVNEYAHKEKDNDRVPRYYQWAANGVALAIGILHPMARFWVVPVSALTLAHGLEAARKSTPE